VTFANQHGAMEIYINAKDDANYLIPFTSLIIVITFVLNFHPWIEASAGEL
jgi:hypothetical protein